MSLDDKYFELCYTERIHEFEKIDKLKEWPQGQARKTYRSLAEFYQEELNIDNSKLDQLKAEFKRFNDLYSKYFNEHRKDLFKNATFFLEWYSNQNESCNYCGINQSELHKIVRSRNGKLTLNRKSKRSRGTLEIEKLDPSLGYTFDNSVLCCPLCNNAKSNLISADDWRKFFVPAMKDYYNSLLQDFNGDKDK